TWLRQLHDEIGVTSVFVTHDQDEALEVADQVVVMNKGRIEQVGTPDEVFHHPKTEFVMQFLGEVNAFQGEVNGGRVHFGSIDAPYPHVHQQVEGDARVFVRPHDVTIDTKSNGVAAMPATVTRVRSAGSSVRIEVLTAEGQTLVAEVSQDRFAGMHVAPGSTVYIRPRHIRVFAAG